MNDDTSQRTVEETILFKFLYLSNVTCSYLIDTHRKSSSFDRSNIIAKYLPYWDYAQTVYTILSCTYYSSTTPISDIKKILAKENTVLLSNDTYCDSQRPYT